MSGILFALTTALSWGSADFCGGQAARRHSVFQVLVWSSLSGGIVLLAGALLWREALPGISSSLWALLAGALGAVGLSALYRGLSLGNAAIVAPTAAVIGAGLPVLFGIFVQGAPQTQQLLGFVLALGGIGLVTRSEGNGEELSRRGFLLGSLAGVTFGAFFITLAQVETGKIFTPLILARLTSFAVALLITLSLRQPVPSPFQNRLALLSGALDASGNFFFLLARQYTRLDIATVVSNFYPAATLLLAYLLVKEHVSRVQWVGAVLCLVALAFISN